jgi:hypothetical protein
VVEVGDEVLILSPTLFVPESDETPLTLDRASLQITAAAFGSAKVMDPSAPQRS